MGYNSLITVVCATVVIIISSAAAFECNMTIICSSAQCNCNNDNNGWGQSVDCNDLVTNNKSFFSCLTTNVTSLSIYGSDITHILETEMDLLINMQIFRIHDSPITSIAPTAFVKLTSLQTLEIQNTSLKDLDPQTFADLTINELRVTGSSITKLSDDHFEPIKMTLTELDLSDNMISEITNGIFKDGNNSLITLDLSGNQLTTVPDQLLQFLSNVTDIDISRNRINAYGVNVFVKLDSLEKIDLSVNVLAGLPVNAFPTNIVLQSLNLSHNVFEQIPLAAFGKDDQVHILDMDYNLLTQLKNGSFKGLRELRELHLSNMSTLTEVQAEAFIDLPLVKRLYLNNNDGLSNISPQAFMGMLNLENLYINDNALTTLNRDMFLNKSMLPALIEAQVQGNPINCSCNMKWVRQEMDNDDNQWIQSWKQGNTALRCKIPENFNDTEVYLLPVYDLTCEKPLVRHHDQFAEVNGEQYYMEVYVDRGIPTVTWTTNLGDKLHPGDVYDPNNKGHDVISVTAILLENNTVHTKLTIKHPTTASEGDYTMRASNVAGIMDVKFSAHPPKDNSTKNLKTVGLIIGAILGTIILLVVFVCVIRVIRQKPGAYRRMDEDPSIQSTDPAVPQSTSEEQGPFTVQGQRSYGGVGDTTATTTTTEKEEDPRF